ncbi:hypothetical protein ACFWIJ_33310, partial [Streptomyces sp. NPDC127079]
HGHSPPDHLDTGRRARGGDAPALAGTPAHTDADKGLAGSSSGTAGHAPEHPTAQGAATSSDKYKLHVDESALGPVRNDTDGVKVVTDRMSAPYLSGAQVDFVDSVDRPRFTIDPPSGSSPHGDAFTAPFTDPFDDLLKQPDVVRVPGDHQLAVRAPRGGTPELHGTAVASGLYTVEKRGTGFVVRQLDTVGGTVVHSWTFKRLGPVRLAEQTVRLGDGPFSGVSVRVTDRSVDSVSDGAGTWPAKLGGEDEIVIASTSGSHVYSCSTGDLLRTITPDVTLPPRPAGLSGPAADSWDAAAHAARGHMGKAATDKETKLFMQGVIGGAFTSKKGYGGFVKPTALEANPGLVDKVKQFNKIAGDLMFEGPNQRMTVWRGVSMDPRAAQADVFVERLPASTSNNRAFQAEWAKNGVNSNRVVFEIDVPADHGKLAMAYPPGYTKAADDALALNQDQWEVTLSPTRLVRTGPARVEDGITVIPVRAEQIPDGRLDQLINEKWSGLQSGEAFEDFGRAFGQDAIRRWEGLGDAVVREGGDGPHVRTFTVGRPGYPDEVTITVTHKVDDNAVSVAITGGDRAFTREWSGTGFDDLAADLRGHVLHNNELLSSLPTPTSWGKELPSPAHPATGHTDTPVPSPTRGTSDTETTPPGATHTTPGTETALPGTAHGTPGTTSAPRPDTPLAGGGQELPGRGTRLTPAQIEEAWFRDGQRVDALFGHVDDPLRQARRDAWRDHVKARYDLGRAEEDLLPHTGPAGSSDGPTVAEIRAHDRVDTARQQYDATHTRLTDLGVDPVRMEADLSALRQLSLKERPRALGGTTLPADGATPPPAHSAPALHSETEAAAPLTPPQQLAQSLGEHTEAQRGVQQAESKLANTNTNTNANTNVNVNAGTDQRPALQAALDKANEEASRIAGRLDEDITQALTDGRLSQRDLNLLVDQFAGAGEIQRALRLQEHALSLDAQARRAPEAADADHFIRTGKEIQEQSLELRGLTQRLEDLVKAGKQSPQELQGLAQALDKAADNLDASLKGFVKDAAELGGVYTLRNEHAPVSTVAHELARKVDDAVKAAGPGDSVTLEGFHGTEFSISRLQRDMPEIARHLRSNKAYAEVPTGNQWKAELPGSQEQWKKIFPEFEDFEKLSDAQKTRFVRELSERNITQLRRDVRELLHVLPSTEREQFEKLLTSLQSLPYRIKHATPAYHAIANSGVMSSQGDLTRRGIRFLASGKSTGKNTSNLGNDDFVFFRMEAGDKPMATRYGPTTLVFDAKVLEERGGWMSLHDQLHPLDRETMRDLKFGDVTVRRATYDKGFEDMGKRARWTYEYPGGGEPRTVSFDQEVFHGAHVQEALALSVVREVHRIGGGFKDDVLRLAAQGEDGMEQMGAVVSKLYRPEAKFGSGLPINPFSSQVESRWPKPLNVHDPEGDGRYLADGTVDPAARAAGKAFDEASDKVRQADNAVVSNNTSAQRFNLKKARPLAEQAVKLTQQFHDLAQGARKDMAKGLLDERTKLLDTINGRIDALKQKPDPNAVKAQPRPGKNQGAGTSSSAAASNGPDLSELPQTAEDALKAVPGISEQMKKMVRALANSDGFRSLPDSKVGAQTTAAVDLGRNAFDKAFKQLSKAN